MAKTIVGLYDDRATAGRVVSALKDAGFTKDHIQFASTESGANNDFEVDASTYRNTGTLTRYGIDEDEAGFYAEGLRRGGSLVVVRAQDQDADTAVDIMAENNPVQYENRHTAYQAAGYSGYDASAPDYTADEMKQERTAYADQGTQRLQEIQEAIKVGKREFVRGAVRVSQHVETEEVSEVVSLREESVRVDRTDVDRELTAAEADAAFEDKTIEVVARAEQPVVEKTARVTGEVEVGLDTTQREETVGGTIRSTHIDVDRDVADMDVADMDMDASTRPAYDYGRTVRASYGDRDWTAAEADVRRDYESKYGDDSLWDDVKDSVRSGWNSVKRAVS